MDALNELRDRLAIEDCLAAYAQAIDRRDDRLLASLFEPGARIHYGVFDGTIEQLLDRRGRPSPMLATHHHIGNIRVKVQGDTARSICYLNAVHRAQGPEGLRDEMVRARYLDRLMRRAGTWRFVERTLVYDWSRVVPSDGRDWWDGATNATAVGRSDGRDPAAGFLD